MKEQEKHSLLKKFYLAAVLPIVIVLMIANAIYVFYKVDVEREDNIRRLGEDVRVMAGQLAIPVWQFDEATVSSLIRSLLGFPLVSCVHLEELDSYGQGVRSTSDVGGCKGLTENKGLVRIEEAVTYEYEGKVSRIGHIVVWADLSHVGDGLRHKFLNELFLFILYVVAFMVGFTIAFKRTVLEPLSKVRDSINFYRKTGVRREVDWKTKDELGLMITEYNSTLERTASAEQALLEKNKVLEQAREEAEKARDEAERSAQAKTEFLANMSHEIRTPMNAIIGLSQIMERGNLDIRQEGYLTRIRNSADILLSLINDILDFSKIDAGHMQLENIAFDLNEVVEKVIDVQSVSATNKNVSFIIDLDPELPQQVMGDPVRLNQVMMNLLSNAIKFTESGHITLALALRSIDSGQVSILFSVRDTGIGIPLEDQNHLFDAFKQADGSTTRKFGGTGLGLAISQKIVTLMGGGIGINSKEGQGSEFYFTVNFMVPDPVDKINLQLLTRLNTHLDTKNTKVNCLIVGESPSTESISKILTHYQIDFHSIHDARLAVRQLSMLGSTSKFIIIWDRASCNLTVSEFMEAFEDLPSTSNVTPVLLVSVKELQQEESRVMHYQRCLVMTKPVMSSRLLKMLINAIEYEAQIQHKSLSNDQNGGAQNLMTGMSGDVNVNLNFQHTPILVVEDNSVNQMVARELLEPYNLDVKMVSDGRQAVDVIQRNPEGYALIFMDLHMPILDGYRATKEIRDLKVDVPIIALTANATTEERDKCLTAGMNDFITKPIEQGRLEGVLQKWISNPKTETSIPLASAVQLTDKPTVMRNDTNVLPTSGQHIDFSALNDRFVNHTQIIPKVLNAFIESFAHFEDEFMDAYNQNDKEVTYRLAHSLKGSAANISADRLREMAQNLEKKVSDDNFKDVLEWFPWVVDQLQKVLRTCQEWIDQHPD